MRAQALLTIAIAGWMWLPLACSGDTEGDGSSGSSDGDGGTDASSGSESGGTGTGGDGTTADTRGASGGTGGTGGTTSGSCPSIEPAIGAGCSEDGQSCVFVNCAAPDYRDDHTLSCFNGAWALIEEVVCDAEPTSCPATAPVRGQACDAATTPGPCTVLNACGVAELAYCMDGSWEFGSAEDRADPIIPGTGGATGSAVAVATTGGIPELPECPVNPPTLGAACCPADYPDTCDYGTAGSGGAEGIVPAVGGASGDSATVQSATVGAGGAGFTTTTVVTTGGGTTGSGGTAPAPECLTCGDDSMVWEVSSDCP
jgi:hypothetical protein